MILATYQIRLSLVFGVSASLYSFELGMTYERAPCYDVGDISHLVTAKVI